MLVKTMAPTVVRTDFVLTSMVRGDVFAASGSTSATGRHPPRAHGGGNLAAYSDHVGPRSVLVHTGPIGDNGEGVRTCAGGSAGEDDSDGEVKLTGCSLRSDIGGRESKLERSLSSELSNNLRTYSGQSTADGTASIAKGSVTRALRTLLASINMAVTINEAVSWPTSTQTNTPLFLAQAVPLDDSGILSLN